MFHVWVGLGLLTGAGEAVVPVSPDAPPSARRVGWPVADIDRRIGAAVADEVARIGAATLDQDARIGEPTAAAGARIGTTTARPPGRRIG